MSLTGVVKAISMEGTEFVNIRILVAKDKDAGVLNDIDINFRVTKAVADGFQVGELRSIVL